MVFESAFKNATPEQLESLFFNILRELYGEDTNRDAVVQFLQPHDYSQPKADLLGKIMEKVGKISQDLSDDNLFPGMVAINHKNYNAYKDACRNKFKSKKLKDDIRSRFDIPILSLEIRENDESSQNIGNIQQNDDPVAENDLEEYPEEYLEEEYLDEEYLEDLNADIDQIVENDLNDDIDQQNDEFLEDEIANIDINDDIVQQNDDLMVENVQPEEVYAIAAYRNPPRFNFYNLENDCYRNAMLLALYVVPEISNLVGDPLHEAFLQLENANSKIQVWDELRNYVPTSWDPKDFQSANDLFSFWLDRQPKLRKAFTYEQQWLVKCPDDCPGSQSDLAEPGYLQHGYSVSLNRGNTISNAIRDIRYDNVNAEDCNTCSKKKKFSLTLMPMTNDYMAFSLQATYNGDIDDAIFVNGQYFELMSIVVFRINHYWTYIKCNGQWYMCNSSHNPGVVECVDPHKSYTHLEAQPQFVIYKKMEVVEQLPLQIVEHNEQPQDNLPGIEIVDENVDSSDDEPVVKKPKLNAPAVNNVSKPKLGYRKRTAPYECDVCGLKSKDITNLRNHLMTHTGERPHMCKYCEQAFTKKGILKTHIRAVHFKEKPHTCTICSKSFTCKHSLQRHMATHSSDKPHKCSYSGCNAAYTLKENLHRHVKTVHKNLKYKCKYCEAEFTRERTKAKHERKVHDPTFEKFECLFCGKKYQEYATLENHVYRRHMKNLLKCPICPDLTFESSTGLKQHMRRDHGVSDSLNHCNCCPDFAEHAFECKHCNRKFTNNAEKRRHLHACPQRPQDLDVNVPRPPNNFEDGQVEFHEPLIGWHGYPQSVLINRRSDPMPPGEENYHISLRGNGDTFIVSGNYIVIRCPNMRGPSEVWAQYTREQVLNFKLRRAQRKRKAGWKTDEGQDSKWQLKTEVIVKFNEWLKQSWPGLRYHPDQLERGHMNEAFLGGEDNYSHVTYHPARFNRREMAMIEQFGRQLVLECGYARYSFREGWLRRDQLHEYLENPSAPEQYIVDRDGQVIPIGYGFYRIIFAQTDEGRIHIFAFLVPGFGLPAAPLSEESAGRFVGQLSAEHLFNALSRYLIDPDTISDLTHRRYITQGLLQRVDQVNQFGESAVPDYIRPVIRDPGTGEMRRRNIVDVDQNTANNGQNNANDQAKANKTTENKKRRNG
jgi:hypothetical protein